MRTYTVFFEIYGKKMKIKLQAASKFDAESQVRKDIKIHEIEDDSIDAIMDMFKDVFGK